jgi:exosortase/archaeosortase family protein
LLVSILVFLPAKILVKYSLPGSDLILSFISFTGYPVRLFIACLSNAFFQLTGTDSVIQNDGFIVSGLHLNAYTTQIMYKKVALFYFILIWLTRASKYNKLIFSGICLFLVILFSTAYNISDAYLKASVIENPFIISLLYSLVFLSLNTALLFWYRINKSQWLEKEKESTSLIKFIHEKIPDLIRIMYIYVLIYLLTFFSHEIWIGAILRLSQRILELFGYEATVQNEFLIGNNGSISMYLGCLGWLTMFLFASVVYLTGNRQNRGWGFIFIGLLILNVANVIRIVLVFIHLQKNGDYMLATDVHDLYNYVTYAFVFILWVIWFERIMGLKSIMRIKIQS